MRQIFVVQKPLAAVSEDSVSKAFSADGLHGTAICFWGLQILYQNIDDMFPLKDDILSFSID